MNMHASIDARRAPLAFTPRTLATAWRQNEALRPGIEADITAAGAWGQFRWAGDTLVAVITTEDREARRGSDACHSAYTKWARLQPVTTAVRQLNPDLWAKCDCGCGNLHGDCAAVPCDALVGNGS